MAKQPAHHSKKPATGKGTVDKTPKGAPGETPVRPRLGPGPAEPPAGGSVNYSSEQQQK